jgi:hypothetical protein
MLTESALAVGAKMPLRPITAANSNAIFFIMFPLNTTWTEANGFYLMLGAQNLRVKGSNPVPVAKYPFSANGAIQY